MRGRVERSTSATSRSSPSPYRLTREELLVRYGMPRSALACARQSGWNCSADLSAFETWVRRSGRPAYVHFLVTHPGYVARDIWQG